MTPPASCPSAGPNRRWLCGLIGIFLLALALRLAYVVEIRDIGFFEAPLSDARVYDQRARGISQGDWLGPADFVHAPLYAYALGIIRIAGFDSPLAPRLMQALLGAGACVLVMCSARRLFRRTDLALLAGALLALYPPAIFFDGLLQKTSMVLFLSALVVHLALVSDRRGGAGWWAITGISLGLLILVRQNALALIPLLFAAVWFSGRATSSATALRWKVAMLLGLAVTLTPWALRNKHVIGDFVLTTPNLGQNFAMGNHPHATGTYLPAQRGMASGDREQEVWARAASDAIGRPATAAEISSYHLRTSLEYIRANPGHWIVLNTRKWLLTWGAYELPDTEDYYLYHEHSRILRWGDAVWHFGVLGPLAIAGIVLTIGQWRRLWMLHAWLVIIALGIAVFVVFARYRAPMLPVLSIFAAAAIVHAAAHVRARNWRALALPGAAALVAAVAMNWPLHAQRSPQGWSRVNHAVALAETHRYDDALIELDRALQVNPKDVDANWIRGSVLLDMGRPVDAMASFDTALAGDNIFGPAHRGRGSALLALGRIDEATDSFRIALELDPRDHMAMNTLAIARATAGRVDEALQLLNQAAAIAPSDADVQVNLGNVQLLRSDLGEAADAYRRALVLQPDHVDALMNLAAVNAQRGDIDDAVKRYQTVLAMDSVPPGARNEALARAVFLMAQQERRDDAIALLLDQLERDAANVDAQRLLDALQRDE